MAIVLYKKKRRFEFKKKNLNILIKLLGYNLRKKRFKYYNINSKVFLKNFRRSKQWKTKRTEILYSNYLNKIKKRTLLIKINNYFLLRYKVKKIYKKENVIKFLKKLIPFLERAKLMDRKGKKIFLRKRLNVMVYKYVSKRKKLKRFKKYLKKAREFYKKRYYIIKEYKKEKNFYLKNKLLFSLILKHSNNNFFITINDYKNRTLWHRSVAQFFESNKHNIKLKRSHLLVNEMFPFFKEKLNEFKIKYFRIYLKSNISRHIYKIIDFLIRQRIKIFFIKFVKPMPHHKGDRRKKLKRR